MQTAKPKSAVPTSQSFPSNSSYPKVFTSEYIDAKVKEVQPYGSEVKKANLMCLVGTGYILEEKLSNGVATFSVESQTDADAEPHHVKISRKSKLSRDLFGQFNLSCSCLHFARPEIRLCKHLIYILKSYYVRS